MKQTFVVAGLAYGDEGKGSITDFLVRTHNAGLVVRYNGGSQAAHNVIDPDGRHHTFSQFGAGTFVPGVCTHLSQFTLLNPVSMMIEEAHLKELGVMDAWKRLTVAEKALIITPYHQALNKLLEWSRGESMHGTCAQGIGTTRSMHLQYGDEVLFAGDTWNRKLMRKKLLFIRDRGQEEIAKLDTSKFPDTADVRNQLLIFTQDLEYLADEWVDGYARYWPIRIVRDDHPFESKVVVFEGAQGVLLDETHGAAPHNTWTDCTYNNAMQLLMDRNYQGKLERVGVVRSYFTRHGVGPFPTEDGSLSYYEPHNNDGCWQGKFRFGKLDLDSLKLSVGVLGGVDWIAMNHLDQCVVVPEEMANIEARLNVNVKLFGFGPVCGDKVDVTEYNNRVRVTENSIAIGG